MKATLKTSDLVAALARMKTVVSRKSTLPILGGILIVADDLGLHLTGTDLDMYLTLDVTAAVAEAGSVVVVCSRLAKAVAEIGGDEIVLETAGVGGLGGKAGANRFFLIGFEPSEFPAIPKITEEKTQEFNEGVMAEALAREIGSVSEDETRFVLNGVYLTGGDGKLQIVATDGRRIAVTDLPSEEEALNVVVPTAVAKLMACLDGGGVTELCVEGSHIQACGKGWRMVGKLIEGNYPDWRQVVPEAGAAHCFTVDRGQFIEAVKFARTVCTDNNSSVILTIEDKTMTVSASAADVGQTFADLNAVSRGGALKVAFKPEYLLSALEVLDSEVVTGEIADEMSPLRIGDGKTVNVLMPMRIS